MKAGQKPAYDHDFSIYAKNGEDAIKKMSEILDKLEFQYESVKVIS